MPDDIRTLEDATDRPSRDLQYRTDEHEWIAGQVAALESGQLDRLDRSNLIDFLTSMALRDRREMRSRFTVLLIHLLKVRLQPNKLTRSWISTILEQQSEIRSLMDGVPSLGRQAPAILDASYPDAVRRGARETRLPADRFPSVSPWTVAEALAFDPPDAAPRSGRGSH